MALIILVLGLLFNIIVGGFVLARNPKSKLHKAVFGLALSFIVWQIANYLADKTSGLTLFWNRATFVGPLSLLVVAGMFLTYLQEKEISQKYYRYILLPVTGFMMVLSFSPYVVESVSPRVVEGVITGYNLNRGWGYILVISWIFYLLVSFGVRLAQAYKKAHGELRAQLKIVTQGIVAATIVGVSTNVLAPLLTDSTVLTKFAPITSVILMGSFAIAIVQERLFDIRFVVVRSVAYLATVAVLASLFGIVVFGTLKLLFGVSLGLGAQVYISIATALAASSFAILKAFFDKASNTLFYRDSYESQQLFDALNQLLVTNSALNKMLERSARLLSTTLKVEFCFFGIREIGGGPQRIIGDTPKGFNPEEIQLIGQVTPRIHRKLIVVDDLGVEHKELRDMLQKNSIAIVGLLSANADHPSEGLGYLVLSHRRSGHPYTSKDLRTLEIILNELVIATENSLRLEEIQNFSDTLQQNINVATKKLQASNEKLKALDETKDEFITMASHQLRTPLTAVKGYLSLVLEGDAGKLNANQRKLLQQSYISSQRMVYLIADLLNLSRLSTGKFIIEPTPTDLSEIVKLEVDQLVETARSRSVTLNYTKPQNFPKLMLDETKIHQVVMNFIDNAIYYTPAGGTINVMLHDTGTAVEYRVVDTGIGVPRAEQHHLFSKFYRADNARRARPDGTGLGLFMAKKVVAAQGGSIIFDSIEGKGSTFGFRFGKRSHAVSDEPKPTESAEIGK
jgi:signal transduction histidine kinase